MYVYRSLTVYIYQETKSITAIPCMSFVSKPLTKIDMLNFWYQSFLNVLLFNVSIFLNGKTSSKPVYSIETKVYNKFSKIFSEKTTHNFLTKLPWKQKWIGKKPFYNLKAVIIGLHYTKSKKKKIIESESISSYCN